MTSPTTAEQSAEARARSMGEGAPAPNPPSPWAALMALVADVREAALGRIQLMSLELKRAGGALAQIVVLGIVAAVMAHMAWVALVVGLAWTALHLGAPWWAVLIATVLIHALVVAWAVWRITRLSRLLGMPASMRLLHGQTGTESGEEPPHPLSNAQERSSSAAGAMNAA